MEKCKVVYIRTEKIFLRAIVYMASKWKMQSCVLGGIQASNMRIPGTIPGNPGTFPVQGRFISDLIFLSKPGTLPENRFDA